MSRTQIGDSMRIGYDSGTGEYGTQRMLNNKTGSVKRETVGQSAGTDIAFDTTGADEPDQTHTVGSEPFPWGSRY